MLIFGKPRGEEYHSRTIETGTYDYDDARFVTEGILTDRRFKAYHLATGDEKQPGILHQMAVRLLVGKADLVIRDLEVEMRVIPREECREMTHCLDPVKGLRIVGGFTAKVREIAGGDKGCSHLVALMTALGPAVIQGYGAYCDHNIPDFVLDHYEFLMNTCRNWREDGPLVAMLKVKREAKREGAGRAAAKTAACTDDEGG